MSNGSKGYRQQTTQRQNRIARHDGFLFSFSVYAMLILVNSQCAMLRLSSLLNLLSITTVPSTYHPFPNAQLFSVVKRCTEFESRYVSVCLRNIAASVYKRNVGTCRWILCEWRRFFLGAKSNETYKVFANCCVWVLRVNVVYICKTRSKEIRSLGFGYIA